MYVPHTGDMNKLKQLLSALLHRHLRLAILARMEVSL